MTVPKIIAETPGIKPTVRVRLCPDPLSPPIRGQKQDLTLQYNELQQNGLARTHYNEYEPTPCFSVSFSHDFIFVVELEIMAAFYVLGEEFFHFVLVKTDVAVIAEFLVNDIVRALFAAIQRDTSRYFLYLLY